ncbi:hypothetical protein HPP92_019658 [Vanilla planifolia]|uniref:Uncharacterized protein n=1 Tax=Vanilla planifolia TaxID=51239 RepID=A0A835Q9E6_VANPL|nr:hypothetical protein HPP92_019658 [Vanilla planifolia]
MAAALQKKEQSLIDTDAASELRSLDLLLEVCTQFFRERVDEFELTKHGKDGCRGLLRPPRPFIVCRFVLLRLREALDASSRSIEADEAFRLDEAIAPVISLLLSLVARCTTGSEETIADVQFSEDAFG